MRHPFLILLFFLVVHRGPVVAQEVNSARLADLMRQAEQTNSEAVIIFHDDQLIAESYFGIGKQQNLIETMSCTKSIVGLAAACLLDDGLLESLDMPVFKLYPEWNQGQKKLITIRHLLNMTSGIQNVPNTAVEIYPSSDFVKLALAAELTESPGQVFRYNNKSMNLMAGIIQKLSGKRMDRYIQTRLFAPLGIEHFEWSLDKAGNPHVMSGCQLRPNDFVKIGLLLMNQGRHGDRQVVSKQNIARVVEPCPQFTRYGLLWWLHYEQTVSTVDDEIIQGLIESKVPQDFLAKMKRMKGRFSSEALFRKKLTETFGPDAWKIVQKSVPDGVQIRKREYRGNVSYSANGYLGNYLIVDPETRIVAVRMISRKSYDFDDTSGKDNFGNFRTLVSTLTQSE